jgi:putative cell wall-binding protein
MKKVKKFLALGLSLAIIFSVGLDSYALDRVNKIQGGDRYETAALIADKQTYDIAILVNSEKSLSDGLSASGLAGTLDAPILLTQKDIIPRDTFRKIVDLKKVYVIGGMQSISNKVISTLHDNGIEVKRIEGVDRIDTSLKVAKEIEKQKTVDKVALVNGYKDADAMSIAPVSVRDKMPIILTNGNSTTYDIKEKTTYIIGGTSSMSANIAKESKNTRFAGENRFKTNQLILKNFYGNQNEFFITDGHKLIDALTGSTLAKDNGIFLVGWDCDYTMLTDANKITELGGINEGILHDIYITIGESESYDQKDLFYAYKAATTWFCPDGNSPIMIGDSILADESLGVEISNTNFKHNGKSFFCFERSEYEPYFIVNKKDFNDAYLLNRSDNRLKKVIPYYSAVGLVDKNLKLSGDNKAYVLKYIENSGNDLDLDGFIYEEEPISGVGKYPYLVSYERTEKGYGKISKVYIVNRETGNVISHPDNKVQEDAYEKWVKNMEENNNNYFG